MNRREAFVVGVALLVAMAAGSALILAFGESPARVYGRLLSSTWGSATGFGQVLFKATPLLFTGLAVSFAYRAGLFNIGAEGQLTLGAFATALVASALPDGTPAAIAIPLAVIAGAVAGGIAAAVPGLLKAWFGAHEVINTIMLNFVIAGLVLWAGNTWFFVGESTHTAAIAPGAELPSLGFSGSAANASTLLAVLTALAVWYAIERTPSGFSLRAVGANPRAGESAGIDLGRAIVAAMTISGALAGLVGSNYVLGYKHYWEEGMGRGTGFMGIAVALLGRNHPVGVVAAALLLGTLSHGGLAVSEMVPKELVDVLQAVIILAVAATSVQAERLWARAAPHKVAHE